MQREIHLSCSSPGFGLGSGIVTTPLQSLPIQVPKVFFAPLLPESLRGFVLLGFVLTYLRAHLLYAVIGSEWFH